MAREVVMGATGAGTSSEMGPILYNSLLGTRFKIVVGYHGAEHLQRGDEDAVRSKAVPTAPGRASS